MQRKPGPESTSCHMIALVEQNLLLCDTLAHALRRSGYGVQAFGSPEETRAALQINDLHPDLTILSGDIPRRLGLKGVLDIVALARPAPVALLASDLPGQFVQQALDKGLKGYVPDNTSFGCLSRIIQRLMAGQTYCPTGELETYADPQTQWGLTARETEIALLVSQGQTNKQIALSLNLSETTVKMHMRGVFYKMDVKNRTQIATAVHELYFPHEEIADADWAQGGTHPTKDAEG